MRRLAGVVLLIIGCAWVAGCTAEPPAPVMPAESESTALPLPRPTPTWSVEEQGAIDAVNAYLEKWTYISQNLQTVDWMTIYEVATNPAVEGAWVWWQEWGQRGWRLTGGPQYEVTDVTLGAFTEFGTEYRVDGCYNLGDGHMVDAEGNAVDQRGDERSPAYYIVLKTHEGKYLIAENYGIEGTC